MKKFYMNKEIITLGQFLKATDYISSGGEAKYYLHDNEVLVNNLFCDLRGKKLFPNDIVKVNVDEYILIYDKKD
ncbi:MAG: RNA-binding S4 domain-containing protein [Acholeplasma sp.]|nr:RNA-binding S4 domain-containing protein [Acholeplasma sp.]